MWYVKLLLVSCHQNAQNFSRRLAKSTLGPCPQTKHRDQHASLWHTPQTNLDVCLQRHWEALNQLDSEMDSASRRGRQVDKKNKSKRSQK
jgi:hypothetical protein